VADQTITRSVITVHNNTKVQTNICALC